MRRFAILAMLLGLALVVQGCKEADACGGCGLFGGGSSGGSYGGYSGGSYYMPAYDGCGGYDPCVGASYDPGYSVQSSGGCCPEIQQVQVNPCDPVQNAPVPAAPEIDLVPQEPDPKMTPVESQDGPEMLPPAILEMDGTIGLVVPAEAIVYINGYRTKKTGTKRTYRSQGLSPGSKYQYNIVVQVGSTQKARVVTLMAGDKKYFAYRQFHPQQFLARK